MKKSGYSVVLISVCAPTRSALELLDLARRQADHLGPFGIRAKRKQTNRRYRRRGNLRLRFPTRQLARSYVRRIGRLGEPAIECRLMHNPNRYS